MRVAEKAQRPTNFRIGFQKRTILFPPFTLGLKAKSPWAWYQRNPSVTYYIKTVFPKVIQSVHERHSTVGTGISLFLHDSASTHKTNTTVSCLNEQNFYILTHTPYSPDFAPCDF